MSGVHNPEQAARAYTYYLEQLWEAVRGLTAAYTVDTGDAGLPVIPAWKDLDEDARTEFSGLTLPSGARLSAAVFKVARS